MGLEKDDSTPPVDLGQRTTKVNISIAIAMIVFFTVAGFVLFALRDDPEKSTTEAIPLRG